MQSNKKPASKRISARKLVWRSGRDSNPRGIAPKLISSVVKLWQIHVWSRSFQATLLRGRNADAARGCGHSDPYRPEAIRTAPKFK